MKLVTIVKKWNGNTYTYLINTWRKYSNLVCILYRALELDCLKNSHPIEVPVGHPSEIDEIFDDISYNKGASVIRMLHRYIGDDDFRKGMHIYLTRHQVFIFTPLKKYF